MLQLPPRTPRRRAENDMKMIGGQDEVGRKVSTSSSLHSDQFQAPDSQILRQIQRKLRSDFSAAADVLATNLRRMSVVEVVELQGQCCGASL